MVEMITIWKTLKNLYSDSDTFYTEIYANPLIKLFKVLPDYLNEAKWNFLDLKAVFKLLYFQYSRRFVRYPEKDEFESFLIPNLMDGLYDLWIKTNWLNDPNIMKNLQDTSKRGGNITETNATIGSPFPIDSKYTDNSSANFQSGEPIQSKQQSERTMGTFNVISDFDSVRGDIIKEVLNEFFQYFNKLFIEYSGLKIQ